MSADTLLLNEMTTAWHARTSLIRRGCHAASTSPGDPVNNESVPNRRAFMMHEAAIHTHTDNIRLLCFAYAFIQFHLSIKFKLFAKTEKRLQYSFNATYTHVRHAPGLGWEGQAGAVCAHSELGWTRGAEQQTYRRDI